MMGLNYDEPQIYSVGEVTEYLRGLIKSDPMLSSVWVRGEVVGLSRPASGHLYFNLKDRQATIKSVMWRSTAMRLRTAFESGQLIEAHGYIDIYADGGQYQLYVDAVRPVGEGAYYLEFLRLKARLEAEGLFDEARKRPLPVYPQRIGVVTSSSGAALRDILNTLQRRYPLANVILAPTQVQGVDAPPLIVAALRSLWALDPPPQVIILGRGGGSAEDLACFNDEGVVRAVAISPIPVVSGVGHETDFTLADFAADLRAATPTAAAERVTPDQAELRDNLAGLQLDLRRAARNAVVLKRGDLAAAYGRLQRRDPQSRLNLLRQRLDQTSGRLANASARRLSDRRLLLNGLEQRLAGLNPLNVLQRGYALVSKADGSLVSRAGQVQAGEQLAVRWQDGRASVRVEETGTEE